ncbi:MAG: hypothetical protein LBH38_04050 [Holosporales bacterium]|nr:hypothetical protein [Holosporales bacterium]
MACTAFKTLTDSEKDGLRDKDIPMTPSIYKKLMDEGMRPETFLKYNATLDNHYFRKVVNKYISDTLNVDPESIDLNSMICPEDKTAIEATGDLFEKEKLIKKSNQKLFQQIGLDILAQERYTQ